MVFGNDEAIDQSPKFQHTFCRLRIVCLRAFFEPLCWRSKLIKSGGTSGTLEPMRECGQRLEIALRAGALDRFHALGHLLSKLAHYATKPWMAREARDDRRCARGAFCVSDDRRQALCYSCRTCIALPAQETS